MLAKAAYNGYTCHLPTPKTLGNRPPMPVQIKIPSTSNRKFEAEIVTLPSTVTVSGTSRSSIIQFVMGLAFSGFGFWLFMDTYREVGFGNPRTYIGLVFGVIGALHVARFLTLSRNLTTMTFHDEFVEVTHRAIFGTRSWRTPYREFKGVRARLQKLKPEMGRKSYYIIELVHDDTSKTLPLYAERLKTPPQDHLEHYAEILDVPILQPETV